MDLNRVRFKNGGIYLDGTKIQGVQKYELTDGINELGTLKLELLVDGSELFKEQSDDSEVSLVLDGLKMDELKQEKNIELIDKSIDYLENLKKNDDIQDFLEVRLVTDDTFLSQEFNVYVSINMKDYY